MPGVGWSRLLCRRPVSDKTGNRMTVIATVLVSTRRASVTIESLDQRVPRGTRTHETRRHLMSWRACRNYIVCCYVHKA